MNDKNIIVKVSIILLVLFVLSFLIVQLSNDQQQILDSFRDPLGKVCLVIQSVNEENHFLEYK